MMFMKKWIACLLAVILVCTGLFVAVPAPVARAAVAWSQTFAIEEKLNLYDFPEELISYAIAPPSSAHVDKTHLKVTDQAGNALEYQLSGVTESGGDLIGATISFRADLPKKASRRFTVAYDSAYTPGFTQHVALTDIDTVAHTAVIAANKQQVKVPYGPVAYSPAVAATYALAPVLATRYSSADAFIGQGQFAELKNAKYTGFTVSSIATSVVEQGPLFLVYRIAYTFSGGRVYTVDITVRHNETYAAIDEYLSGFDDADYVASGTDNGGGLFYRFDYTSGLDPTGRISMSNNGYNIETNKLSGFYGRGKITSATPTPALLGKLPYELGLFAANSLAITRSTAFWNETAGSEALQFAVNRPGDWKMDRKLVWNSPSYGNLRFYETVDATPKKLMQTRLEGTERHWALSAIPHGDLVISGYAGGSSTFQTYNIHNTSTVELEGYPTEAKLQFGAASDVRLWEKLTDFSLNKYKDMVLDGFAEDVNEKLDLPAKFGPVTVQSYDEWIGLYFPHLLDISEKYWDWSSGNEGIGRGLSIYIQNYAASRAYWTQSQRDHVKALLLFLAYAAEDDSWHPYRSMLSGHPNFIADNKQILGLVTAVFRHHPHADAWKAAYTTFLNDYLNEWVRQSDSANDAIGGRHTENLATYTFASLQPTLHAAAAIRQYDGSNVLDDNRVKLWLNWIMNTMMPVEKDNRYVPPQGAHASGALPGDEFGDVLPEAATFIRPFFPELADQLAWSTTSGETAPDGVRPNLESTLFTDYGAVMRYDFGGDHEAYVNLQQLNGSQYRWNGGNNGNIFYASEHNRWSWNGEEDSEGGSTFDLRKLNAASVSGDSILNPGPIRNVLYDFDFAQFYKVPNGSSGKYTSRGVMMVEDRYLSVYDDLADTGCTTTCPTATFNWNRQTSGMWGEYYSNTDLTGTLKTRMDNNILFSWLAGKSPIEGIGSTYSVRWKSNIQPQYSENYTLSIAVNKGDKVRVWLEGALLIDQWSPATAITTYTTPSFPAAADRYYALRVEYAHTDATVNAQPTLRWQSAHVGNAVIPLLRAYYRIGDLPGASPADASIYSIKGGTGDILNLVAGSPLASATALTSGGKTVGSKVNGAEYSYTSDATFTYADATSGFTGKTGYAKDGGLAVFEGTAVHYGGFAIGLPAGATFGASAQKRDDDNIVGRIAGTATAQTVTVTAPSGFHLSGGVTVSIDNAPVAATVYGSTVSFPVTVTPADGYKTYAIRGSGATSGADLTVTNIVYSPSAFASGEPVTFTAVVTNRGTVDTPGHTTHRVKFVVDGTTLYGTTYSSPIAPGRTMMIRADAPWTPSAGGAYTVRATIDDNGAIAESNETNNAYNKSIVVPQAQPDLIVTEIQWPQAYLGKYVTENNAIKFQAVIQNIGKAATPAGTHRVGFRIDNGPTTLWSTSFASSLAPGESQLVTVTDGTYGAAWKAVFGAHSVKAIVDDPGAIGESNESNNEFGKTITVGRSLLDANMDTGFAGTTDATNPFAVAFANTGGTTRIVAVNGTDNAVEFRDNNDAGNAAGSTFSAQFDSASRVVNRINEIFRRPTVSDAVYFALSFKLERTEHSTAMVPTSTGVDIQTNLTGDAQLRFLLPLTGITTTAAYAHEETSGSKVLEPVGKSDLAALRFAVVPSGGAKQISSLKLEFSVRVGGTGPSAEAYVIDDIALVEEARNLLEGDFDIGMDSVGADRALPIAAMAGDTGGLAQLVSVAGDRNNRNTVLEVADTTAGSAGAGAASLFAGEIGGGVLLDRINAVLALPSGSSPVDYVFSFDAERRTAGTAPTGAGIAAAVQFVTTADAVIEPMGSPAPSFYSSAAYGSDEVYGSETLQKVTDADVPAYRFTVTPDGGATVLKAIRLLASVQVGAGSTPEAYAVDNFDVHEIASTPLAVAGAGFETGTSTTADNWLRTGWVGSPVFSRGTDQAHDGSYSAKIVHASFANGGWSKSDPADMLPVTANRTYAAGAWLRTSGVSAGTDEGAYVYAQFYDSANNAIGTSATSTYVTGTSDWTYRQVVLKAPAGATKLRFDLRLRGTGTAWFDGAVARKDE